MSKHKDITLPLVRRAFLAGLVGIMSLAGTAEAQNGFNMPFSQFGIGLSDLPYTMPMAQRSGAIITRAGNNYINPFNPASYASIESQSFVFDMGLNIQTSRLSSGSQSATDADGNIGYLAIGMPVTSWWKVGAGLMPYSSMDYSSVSEQRGDGYGTMKTIYDGTGGASQVFVGSAFNIPAGKSTRLQAGFNVSYLTGRVERAISYRFMGNDSTYYINSRRYKRTKVSNVVLDFGVQMWQELGEKLTLGAGLTYKPYMDLTVGDMALIYTYSTSDESLIDTIFPARGEEPEFRSRLEQPQSVGVGLSLQYAPCGQSLRGLEQSQRQRRGESLDAKQPGQENLYLSPRHDEGDHRGGSEKPERERKDLAGGGPRAGMDGVSIPQNPNHLSGGEHGQVLSLPGLSDPGDGEGQDRHAGGRFAGQAQPYAQA